MVYLWYKVEKDAYLAAYPRLCPENYQKHRKWQRYTKRMLQEKRRKMPFEQREPSGQLIASCAEWTDDEVTAILDYNDILEEREYERQTELVRTEGYIVKGRPRDI